MAMERSVETIQNNIDPGEAVVGAEGVKNFVFSKIIDILVPLISVVGILLSLIGFYKLLFSSDEKAISEGVNYIIYGIVGIVIIMSAKYIGSTLYEGIFSS